MKRIIKLLLLLSFAVACASSNDNGPYKKSDEVNNTIAKHPPAPWSEMSSEGSDYALTNNKTNSIFLFNSACRKYEGSNLNTLTSSMLAGLQDVQILEQKKDYYQGREGVDVLASGKLDGIERFFRIVTIQKNNCIYDYILIATNRNNINADAEAMQMFLKGIVLK